MSKPNPTKKPKPEELMRQQSDFVLEWLQKLAAATRVELSEATIGAYTVELISYPADKLEIAFQRTKKEWDRPSQFPTIPFILSRVENHQLAAEQQWQLA